MYSHQPSNYVCPCCQLIHGENTEINKQSDIVYQDELTLAYVAPKWWPNNPGSILVIPKEHQENLYTISDDSLSAVYRTVKKIAIAIRETYDCQGTSTRQHNEPFGGQTVWHFHVHVFARSENDQLYQNHMNARWIDHYEKNVYAERLLTYFSKHTKM